MKIITEVKCITVPDADIHTIEYSPEDVIKSLPPDEPLPELEVVVESIRGVEFITPTYEKVRIGFSQQATQVLGLSYDVYKNMSKQLDSMRADYNREYDRRMKVEAEFSAYKNAGILERIKRVFRGG